jgi:hypothetical protein
MSREKKTGAGIAEPGTIAAEKAPTSNSASEKFASKRSGQQAADKSGKFTFARRFPRFPIDIRMQVRMFQDGEFRTCWGRSTELGQDGIGATLTGSLQSGEIVTLEIPLPLTPYPIKVRAIVRYCQGLRYGFEFLTMNESQRDTIRRVCDYLATKA